jgi:hypothetical protein
MIFLRILIVASLAALSRASGAAAEASGPNPLATTARVLRLHAHRSLRGGRATVRGVPVAVADDGTLRRCGVAGTLCRSIGKLRQERAETLNIQGFHEVLITTGRFGAFAIRVLTPARQRDNHRRGAPV